MKNTKIYSFTNHILFETFLKFRENYLKNHFLMKNTPKIAYVLFQNNPLPPYAFICFSRDPLPHAAYIFYGQPLDIVLLHHWRHWFHYYTTDFPIATLYHCWTKSIFTHTLTNTFSQLYCNIVPTNSIYAHSENTHSYFKISTHTLLMHRIFNKHTHTVFCYYTTQFMHNSYTTHVINMHKLFFY